MPQRRLKRSSQFRSGPLHLGAVRQGQLPQRRAAGRSKAEQHFPLVLGSGTPGDRALGLESIHQLDRAVMFDEQTRRNLADRRPDLLRKSLHGEQELMLLRFDAVLLGRGLAEMKKLPDLPAKFGQVAILANGKIVSRHIYIVPRYKWR